MTPGLGVYLHVPFCQAICGYCNFNRGLFDAALKTRYVDALVREIETTGRGGVVDSVFFGGGTPSLLESAEIARILDACGRRFTVTPDAEITVEVNPETADVDRLQQFLAAGVNRLSVGIQSFDSGELTRLGRVHSSARAIEALHSARAAGFQNISLDLMLWLPGQTQASWRRTVATAIDLSPDHLSLYLLELYPNAPLKEAVLRQSAPRRSEVHDPAWDLPTDDDAADMYLEAFEALGRAGLHQYEISNAARSGCESRHNLKYWTSGAWQGFGCGAHSTIGDERWRNISSTTDYIDRVGVGQAVSTGYQSLSERERQSEALFTGLRLSAGVSRRNFADRFGVDPWIEHGAGLAACERDGLVWMAGDRFGLSRRGMLVANEILTMFV